jgi:FkbM family methyltransferase
MIYRKNLIYDIGMHTGRDAEFYLKKGFDVIAVEAANFHVVEVKNRLKEYINDGKLTIIEAAIADSDGKEVSFYLNPDKDDWGSLSKSACEKGMNNSVEVSVTTISLTSIFSQFGVPYYLKCDIEGGDETVIRQLQELRLYPDYLSFEANDPWYFDALVDMGYTKSQLVNQNMNYRSKPPYPSREGTYVDAKFDGHCSGPFGNELDPTKWFDTACLKTIFENWQLVNKFSPDLVGYAWIDVHSKRG